MRLKKYKTFSHVDVTYRNKYYGNKFFVINSTDLLKANVDFDILNKIAVNVCNIPMGLFFCLCRQSELNILKVKFDLQTAPKKLLNRF